MSCLSLLVLELLICKVIGSLKFNWVPKTSAWNLTMSHGAMCLEDKVCASRKGGTREMGGCQGTHWGATSLVESASSFRRPICLHIFGIFTITMQPRQNQMLKIKATLYKAIQTSPSNAKHWLTVLSYLFKADNVDVITFTTHAAKSLIDASCHLHCCLAHAKEGTKFMLAKQEFK